MLLFGAHVNVVAVVAFFVPVFVAAGPSFRGVLGPEIEFSSQAIHGGLRMLLGQQNSERLENIKNFLRPTFTALPKNAAGNIEARAVRYALHRYFLLKHGWHIKGITLYAGSQESLSAGFESKMPSMVLQALEEELGNQRVGLGELAVVAATIEDLVHGDDLDLLRHVYSEYEISTDDLLDVTRANMVVETYAAFLIEPRLKGHPISRVRDFISGPKMLNLYPQWNDLLFFAYDLRLKAIWEDQTRLNPFVATPDQMDFVAMAQWVGLIGEGIGKHLDTDCKLMRNDMLDLEDNEGTDGRIPLSKFYAPALADAKNFQFSESPAYLRHLGALDETNPRQPKAIVPNILYGVNNCLAVGGFRRLCCIDDCEALKSQLEGRFLQPSVSPQLLAAAISEMPSDTVAAPRNISAPLVQRLSEIAQRHKGTVPLHSRLFAQWMHYAYPNECPYPVSLLTSEAPSGVNQRATKEEMELLVNSNSSDHEETEAGAIPWSEDEELLTEMPMSPEGKGTSIRRYLVLIAMSSIVLASWKSFSKSKGAIGGDELPKHSKSHLV